jgi:Flp pilus assembly protein TadD
LRSLWEFGSSGPNASSGSIAGRALKVLLRFATFYALIYYVVLLLQPAVMRAIAAVSERVLWRIGDPPFITSLESSGNIIMVHSFITGRILPLASWNGENLHLFLVASLALVLAVPIGRGITRWRVLGATLPVVSIGMVAACIVQLTLVAQTYATDHLGMTLHLEGTLSFLHLVNRGLIMVGMLLIPAFLFLMTYMSCWVDTQDDEGARGGFGSGIWLGIVVALAAAVVLLHGRPVITGESYERGLKRLLDLNPEAAQPPFSLGVFHHEAGRFEEARRWYEEATLRDPHLDAAHFGLGNVLYLQGDLEKASASYREVIRLHATHVDAHYNLGTVLFETGQFADAAASFTEAVQLSPNHASAHKNLGVALEALNRPCDALSQYELSSQLDRAYYRDPAVQGAIARLKAECGR